MLQIDDERLNKIYMDVLGGADGQCTYDPVTAEMQAGILLAVANMEPPPPPLKAMAYKTLFNAEAASAGLWNAACLAIRSYIDEEHAGDLSTTVANRPPLPVADNSLCCRWHASCAGIERAHDRSCRDTLRRMDVVAGPIV